MKIFTKSSLLLGIFLMFANYVLAQNLLDGKEIRQGDNCLKAYYPFNNNIFDMSGNNLNGLNHGATCTDDMNGNLQSAYSFDGSTSYIDLPDAFDYQSKTINVWFKATNINTNGGIIYGSDNANILYGITSLFVINIGGVNKLGFNIGGAILYTNIDPNTWYMATLVRGSSYTKFYKNAVLVDSVASGSGHSSNGSATAKIGTSRNANNYFFAGIIDELRVYNCEVSPQEIATLYASVESNEPSSDNLNIFPNPITTSATISLNQAYHKLNLAIYDLQGKIILQNLYNDCSQILLKCDQLNKGMYFLKLTMDDNWTETAKIVVGE